MKKILIVYFVFLNLSSQSQIPNSDFENWTWDNLSHYWEPDNWHNAIGLYLDLTVLRDVGRNGSGYSARFETTFNGGGLVGGWIEANPVTLSGTVRPTSLKGWWKINNFNKDYLEATVFVNAVSGGIVGTGILMTDTNTSIGWTNFSVPINYSNNVPVGSASIYLQLHASLSPTLVANANVDDLSFDFGSGIADNPPALFHCSLNSIHDNYFLSVTAVAPLKLDIIIFDNLGRTVHTKNNVLVIPGDNNITLNENTLPSGIYTCVISDGKTSVSLKMTTAK